jgi:NAD(P)H-hydrate epimerase
MTTARLGGAADALPADDAVLFEGTLGLDDLSARWASHTARRPISAEQMRGIDARAQRFGVPGDSLMEHAGAAVAAAALALIRDAGRTSDAPVVILCGPGNNGGDGFVAARHLARAGWRTMAVIVDSAARPRTPDAARNWDRLADVPSAERARAATRRDVALLRGGVERSALVVDALLGTGVRGRLRDPIAWAVDLVRSARAAGVPVLAVDTPTALDLTSGEPSDPVVRADATVTFHRPKLGLATPAGRALAGRVLVAPIGIPVEADPS